MTTTNNEEVPKHKEALLDIYSTKEEIEDKFLDPSKNYGQLKRKTSSTNRLENLSDAMDGSKKNEGWNYST